MKYIIKLTLISTLLFIFIVTGCEKRAKKQNEPITQRECVIDKVAHILDSVTWDIPNVNPLCWELNTKKEKINIGDCDLYVEEEGEGVPIILIHGGPGATHSIT